MNMKKIGIISVCLLATLIIIYAMISIGDKSTYDKEKTPSAEGEEIVIETEVENTEPIKKTPTQPQSSTPAVTPEHVGKYNPQSSAPADRTLYAYGFYYEPLPENIILNTQHILRIS